MKSALGQISGCLDTAWTVLGHVLGQAWFGFLACPEAARRVLGGNRGEGEAMLDAARMVLGNNGGQREALLHALPGFLVVNKFKEKTYASLIQSGMSFSLNLFITMLPRHACICSGSCPRAAKRSGCSTCARCTSCFLALRSSSLAADVIAQRRLGTHKGTL